MHLSRFIAVWLFVWMSLATLAARSAQSRPARGSLPATQEVAFTTDDNLVIHAGYTPAEATGQKAPIAILVHMYGSDRSDFAPLIAPLHTAGFAVLAIDLRGHGQSVNLPEMRLRERVTQRDRKLFGAMYKDVEAALLWALDQPGLDPARVAVVGASVGASIALDYAARDRSVDAAVCLTPGTSYLGIDSPTAIEKYGRRPLLVIASEPERLAAEQLARGAPSAQLKIYPLSGGDSQALHGTRMLGRCPNIEREIVDFLVKAVGPPTHEMVMASLKGQVYYAPDASMASHLNKRNVRWFSSPAEAEERGLHAPKSGARGRGSRGKAAAASDGEPFPDPTKR